ncbi:hypothetical protein LMH87_010213 [Akanthomyces muscarius]|uniref:Uncharacterized protein n=1 Tax=Akanthomyces muscarius TaxID=2231603 RepID=A0A9W8QG78_AKAMU|nr:hypothetical protein LMH87_010213 [Akanthomyces muscarius]KAJ4153739.1 hypothetical protein LMH87_010213 [Akanthomyces muscarius]
MTSSLLTRPWSHHSSAAREPNYFDIPMQAFSTASPSFLMNLVTPSATGINANLDSPGWKTLGSVGTATDAASSPPATTPALHSGPSPPFGVDPPRSPRNGEAFPDPADAESVFVRVRPCSVFTEASSSFFVTPYQPRAAADTKLYGYSAKDCGCYSHKSKNWHDEETLGDTQAPANDDQAHHEKAIPGLGKTGTWLREEFGNGKKTMKIFGRVPWNRKDSTASFSSVSSSIREVLRGDTPPASPLLADNAAYLNHKWTSNTFPGGEAVRVSTPPMDEDTADGRPRGFFGLLTPPQPETAGSQAFLTPMTSVHASPKYNAHRMSLAVPSREWWEGKPQKPVRYGETSSAAKFEFDVPEHLPNSPMCPANGRHKSGGTGLCVYHGRRRALSTVRDEGNRRRDSGSTS